MSKRLIEGFNGCPNDSLRGSMVSKRLIEGFNGCPNDSLRGSMDV